MMVEKPCPHCGGERTEVQTPFSHGGFFLGKFTAHKCTVCSRVYFPLDSMEKIEEAAKDLGIWGTEVVQDTERGSNIGAEEIDRSTGPETETGTVGLEIVGEGEDGPSERKTTGGSGDDSAYVTA